MNCLYKETTKLKSPKTISKFKRSLKNKEAILLNLKDEELTTNFCKSELNRIITLYWN